MAIDIVKNAHGYGFPSKLLAGIGGAHIFNVTLTAAHDNGTLVARGAWNSFDNYTEGTIGNTNDFAGVIREANIDDPENLFYCEVTADTDLLFVYDAPISEYEQEEFQDLALYYNKAGETVKAYSLRKGDIIMLSKKLFNGTPTAGKTLTYVNGKYVVAP